MPSPDTIFGLFISATMFFAGLLTYLYRDRPNHAIGVRIGYTFQSREAWRRTNEFAGKAFMVLGVLLGILSFTGNVALLTVAMLVGTALIIKRSFTIARETVELEDISTPAVGEPKPISKVDVRPYLAVQGVLLASYLILLAVSWGRMPEIIAVHFDARGMADRFEPKSIGAFLTPVGVSFFILGLTYLGRDPLALRIPKGNEKVARIILELLTAIQFIIWSASVYSILYNAYSFSSPAFLDAIVLGGVGLIVIETLRLIVAVRGVKSAL
ncbi:SdpI family protein [Thermococcus thermotolerans]|uniref:SdpI family protein n=1 Tax=Thermococcus thermotolerans TaxID=2969672 RepID=UPI002157C258|nr:SdpI family protein [Thermococcus thermotolerans]